MDYLIAPPALQGLEAAAQQGNADAMAACAWHLRQRDSREALAWCDRLLAADAQRWQARLALVRCEVAALQGSRPVGAVAGGVSLSDAPAAARRWP